jgi:hypothetical protein
MLFEIIDTFENKL